MTLRKHHNQRAWARLVVAAAIVLFTVVPATRDESRVIDAYLGSFSPTPVPTSRLVDIVFTSADPRLAAALANGHAHTFIDRNLEFKFLASQDASDWLGERLAEQRAAVEAAEADLNRYRQEHGAVSFEERENVTVQRLVDLNGAVTRARTELIAKEAEYRQLEAAGGESTALDTLPVVASNSFIQQLKGELAVAERQRAELDDTLGPRHPDMIKLQTAIGLAQARLESETNKVIQSVRNEFLAAQAQERSLARELENQKVQMLAMNEIGIEYSVLLREAESTRQVYDSLLQRARETGVSTELRNSSIRIVDEAEVPRAPFSPNTSRAVLLALLLRAGRPSPGSVVEVRTRGRGSDAALIGVDQLAPAVVHGYGQTSPIRGRRRCVIPASDSAPERGAPVLVITNERLSSADEKITPVRTFRNASAKWGGPPLFINGGTLAERPQYFRADGRDEPQRGQPQIGLELLGRLDPVVEIFKAEREAQP